MNTCKNYIPVVCLDGGPCSGKSTVLEYLEQQTFEKPVAFIPELATGFAAELQERGLDYPTLAAQDRAEYLDYQRRIIGGYIGRIAVARQELQATGGIIVTDRGPAGIKAYVDDAEWPGLTAEFGSTPQRMMREHADSTIFLHSLAIADPDRYRQVVRSNPIRTETVEQAVALDERSRRAWDGHPDVLDIGGSDIEAKAASVRQRLARLFIAAT